MRPTVTMAEVATFSPSYKLLPVVSLSSPLLSRRTAPPPCHSWHPPLPAGATHRLIRRHRGGR
jgi:hypothetical protein